MTADHLKQLLENGVTLVFAKILNASHNVRGCCALELEDFGEDQRYAAKGSAWSNRT